MARKLYATDGKIIVGDNAPQVQVGDKNYIVDNRKSTFDKMQKELEKEDSKDSVIIEFALGKEAFKEIEKLDLSVESYKNLIIVIFAAIQNISFEEQEEQTKKAPSK